MEVMSLVEGVEARPSADSTEERRSATAASAAVVDACKASARVFSDFFIACPPPEPRSKGAAGAAFALNMGTLIEVRRVCKRSSISLSLTTPSSTSPPPSGASALGTDPSFLFSSSNLISSASLFNLANFVVRLSLALS
jgi:hypothetical protein